MINKISIGSAQFGMSYGLNNSAGEVSQCELNSILDSALDSGIHSIDTAKAYGRSEEKLGEYFKTSPYKWDVTTKIGSLNSPIKHQLNDSIEKLSIRPNTVLAHNFNLWNELSYQNQINQLKSDKKINKIGLSVYNSDEIKYVLSNYKNVDVIQLPINILDTRLIKNGLIKKLYQSNIEIHARSIFLQGLFFLTDSQIKQNFEDAIKPIRFLRKIITKEDITLAEFSLLFVSSLSYISKVIIGLDSKTQLDKNILTINKITDPHIFAKALLLSYNNDLILNPSKWK